MVSISKLNNRLAFSDFVKKVISEAEPMGQNIDENNLGFGWIYYGFIRNLRPKFVVTIGSRRGFMPLCAAHAVQDNKYGKVIFIDPSYTSWGGEGFWADQTQVNKWFEHFGLNSWITHLKMTSEEAFSHVKEIIKEETLGLVIIDGAHTYENSLQDFELYSSLMTNGFVLFHDSTNSSFDVSRTIETLRSRGYDLITIDLEVGTPSLRYS